MKPPIFDIDPAAFHADPYPTLARMRAEAPVCFVPQLDAVLLTRRDDVATCEKNIATFSSEQPGGLMTVLMGENMMRKDGDDHRREREQSHPAYSPRTVRDRWLNAFRAETARVLDDLAGRDRFDVVADFATPVSGHALRHVTGLLQLTPQDIDAASQAMIDGVSNYAGLPEPEARCRAATAMLDAAIDEVLASGKRDDDASLIAVLARAGQPDESLRANIKLAISGGQNEPRDAIAGLVWAMLTHPDQRARLESGEASWRQAFEEYGRWIAPIGMSPRRIARADQWRGFDLEPGSRAFLMFSSANRDEDVFDTPDRFDVTRDTTKAVTFGAGPHFCAGAAVSRTLIAEVAMPMFLARFPQARLDGDVSFEGWAFRGPRSVPVAVE